MRTVWRKERGKAPEPRGCVAVASWGPASSEMPTGRGVLTYVGLWDYLVQHPHFEIFGVYIMGRKGLP